MNPGSNGSGGALRVALLGYQRRWTGAALSLLDLVDALPRHGIVPHVVLQTGSPVIPAVEARRVPLAHFPLRRWMERRASRLWPARAVGRMARNLGSLPGLLGQLRAWRVDLVVTNNAILPAGAFAAALLRVPHVWIIREFGIADADSHHDFGRAVFDFWLRRATRLIAVSHAVREAVLGSLPRERVEVIHNGVAFAADFETLANRARSAPRRRGGFTFVLAGRVQPKKGQESAIRALARLALEFPEARLEIIGDGEVRDVERCRALAGSLGLAGRVTFHGHVTDIWPHFLRADAALMCSVSEAMGRVTAEAMAACRPVIGRAAGGTPELVQHERTGLLYTGGDAALAAAMRRCLEAPDWVRQLGEQAGRDARERFTIELSAARVACVLRDAARTR